MCAIVEVQVFLVVRQTAVSIKVHLYSKTSSGDSEITSHYGDGSRAEAIVVYRNRPHDAGALVAHQGTTHYVFQRDGSRIDGRHWTDRFTRGNVVFTERVPGYADSYADAERMFAQPSSA